MPPSPAAMACNGPGDSAASCCRRSRGNPGATVSSCSASMISRCSPGLSFASLTSGSLVAGRAAVQLDAHRRAERRGDVEPADAVRRGGTQADLAGPLGAAAGHEVQLVPGAPVVGDGEQPERNQVGVRQAQRDADSDGVRIPHAAMNRAPEPVCANDMRYRSPLMSSS